MQESQQEEHMGVQATSSKSKKWLKVLLAVLVIILLALLAYVAWQWKKCEDNHKKDQSTQQTLQKKVDDLTKQLAKKTAGGSTGGSSSGTSSGTCATQVAISQSLKENISAAISSKNTAALAGYMASSVNVVYAASEKSGNESPDAAVSDLDYVNTNATSPWDFNLSIATINSYKAGFYKQYFEGERYVGKSANNYVISFGFDTCAKINEIFVSASADLLT